MFSDLGELALIFYLCLSVIFFLLQHEIDTIRIIKPLVTCSASKLRVQELVSDTSLAVLSFKCYSLVSIRNHPVFVCFLSINDYSDDFFSPMSHTSVISDEFVEIHTTLQL